MSQGSRAHRLTATAVSRPLMLLLVTMVVALGLLVAHALTNDGSTSSPPAAADAISESVAHGTEGCDVDSAPDGRCDAAVPGSIATPAAFPAGAETLTVPAATNIPWPDPRPLPVDHRLNLSISRT